MLTYDFSQKTLDVVFTGIHQALDPSAKRYDNMHWNDLVVRHGRFGDGFAGCNIEGRFYGPNHEEVGGIFERDDILGSFGARR